MMHPRKRRHTIGGLVLTVLFALFGATVPRGAIADETPKAAKTAELVQLTGMTQLWEQAKTTALATARERVHQVAAQIFASFPTISPELRAGIDRAAEQYVQDVSSSFDANDAAQAYVRFYSEGLTEKDLDGILKYYRSPIGQKDLHATQAAVPQLQAYLVQKQGRAITSATARYTQTLKDLIAAAKTTRNPATPAPESSPPAGTATDSGAETPK